MYVMSLFGLLGFIFTLLLQRYNLIYIRLHGEYQKQIAAANSVRARTYMTEKLFEYGYQDEEAVNSKLAVKGLSCRDFEDMICDKNVSVTVL